MAGKVYVEKNRRVNAEQFMTAQLPWPPGVSDSGSGPVFRFPSGITVPIHDTNWITTDVRSGAQDLLTDAEFQDRYGAGPPAEIQAGG